MSIVVFKFINTKFRVGYITSIYKLDRCINTLIDFSIFNNFIEITI